MRGLDAWLTRTPPESPEPDSLTVRWCLEKECFKWDATFKNMEFSGEVEEAESVEAAEESVHEQFLDHLSGAYEGEMC